MVRWMNNEYNIVCENVSKVYDLNVNKKDKLISLLTFGFVNNFKPFYALRDINFKIKPGTSVGILGLNGSGKSTLSNILAGVVEPTSGSIYSKSPPSLIAIGAGLNNDFTGIENIHYKCLMHGMSQAEIDEKINDIIEFSELGDFINQPLKNYSSGMRSRLGFSIAIHTDPDILIIDEALSVGDETFSNKCLLKIKEFQSLGKTIFFVSHSAQQILKNCDMALWIHYGRLIKYGDVKSIITEYRKFISEYKNLSKESQISYKKYMSSTQQIKSINNEVKNEVHIKKSSIGIIGTLVVFLIYMITVQLGISIF